MADVSRAALEGTRLGRYRLRYKVAQGGMASVYLAQLEGTHGFGRWVAVKIIHPHLATEKRFVEMLLDEARVAARIHHPNVCSVLDFGMADEQPYLVMEYLHGETVASIFRCTNARGPRRPPWFVARIVADAAQGLHAAHELRDDEGAPLSVVHRDVSPQNIITLYDGVSRVLDFGIARARGRLTSTEAGELKGKFSYMAPEQLDGDELDRRADVWALGVVLWELSTGQRLFRADSGGRTVSNVINAPIARPSELVPDYPPALEEIVMGALQRDVEKRTESADVMGEALERFLHQTGESTGTRRVASVMKELFPKRLELRTSMLRAAPLEVDEISVVDLQSGSMESNVRPAREGPTQLLDPPDVSAASPGRDVKPTREAKLRPGRPADAPAAGAASPEPEAPPPSPGPAPKKAEEHYEPVVDPEDGATLQQVPFALDNLPTAPIAAIIPAASVAEPEVPPEPAPDPAPFSELDAEAPTVPELAAPDPATEAIAPPLASAEPSPVEQDDVWAVAGRDSLPDSIRADMQVPGLRRRSPIYWLAGLGALLVLGTLGAWLAFAGSGEDSTASTASPEGDDPGAQRAAPEEPGLPPALPEPEEGSEPVGEAAAAEAEPSAGEEPAPTGEEPEPGSPEPESPAPEPPVAEVEADPPEESAAGEAPEAPPAAIERGTLLLRSSMPASVYERRRLLGRTPLTVRLRPGVYALRLHPTGGGAPKGVTVRIEAGRRTRRMVELSPY